jgi:hypothetical protein
MRKSLYILTLALLPLLATCGKKVEMDPVLYESDTIALMVKGKTVFTFDEGTMQLGFNRSRRQFRASNDDMTSFFIITCSDLPRQEGQELTADVQWGSGSSVRTSSGLTFKVEKYDGTGLVWLWCATDKTGAVVRILN